MEGLTSRGLLAERFHVELIRYYASTNSTLISKDRTVVQLQPDLIAGTAVEHADALLMALGLMSKEE